MVITEAIHGSNNPPVLSLDQAKLDSGVALLSTHRLIWRDVKNHVRQTVIARGWGTFFTDLSLPVLCVSHDDFWISFGHL